MMFDTLTTINALAEEPARQAFQACCGSQAWVQSMVAARPFASASQLHESADEKFDQLSEDDWLEAFRSHPKIGDVKSEKMKLPGNDHWSKREQAGIENADNKITYRLKVGNERYEARFGYIYIVCASGKSASELLTILENRLQNEPTKELIVAAEQQRMITHLRLGKLLDGI